MMCVDYDEGYPETYKGIFILGRKETGAASYTGNIIEDYNNVHQWSSCNIKDTIAISSDFDNFFMDSGKYTYILNRKYQMIGIKKVVKRSKKKKALNK